MVFGRGKRKVKVEGSLAVVYFREGAAFIAYTPSLDLSSYGASFAEAKRNFREALDVFFEDLVERGTLEQVLKECGWTKKPKPTPHWVPPAVVGHESLLLSA